MILKIPGNKANKCDTLDPTDFLATVVCYAAAKNEPFPFVLLWQLSAGKIALLNNASKQGKHKHNLFLLLLGQCV